ncbi:hypothetical protein ISCGN_028868 [Ixodes scapularis]
MHEARATCSPWEDHGGTEQHYSILVHCSSTELDFRRPEGARGTCLEDCIAEGSDTFSSWVRGPDDASAACPYCFARRSAVGLRHILWNCSNLNLSLTQAQDLNLASPEDYYKWTRVNAHAGALLGFIRDA